MGRFEDLASWQRARDLVCAVYRVSGYGRFRSDFELRNHVRRAAISVMSNIAEGFERGGDVEFARFLDIARGSCGEVRCQFYVAYDQGYIDDETFGELLAQASEVSRMLAGFARTVRRGARENHSNRLVPASGKQ